MNFDIILFAKSFKRNVLLSFLFLCTQFAFAQQITPSVWMSSGSTGSLPNGNYYSWTMGETFIVHYSQDALTMTQGFQQFFDVLGCTDTNAFNYNPFATLDDGSCIPMISCQIDASFTTLCEGESQTLSMTTSGGGNVVSSFVWSTASVDSFITISPSVSSSFVCVVTKGAQWCSDTILININPLLTWYADTDGDGFGNTNALQMDCIVPIGFVSNHTDCNDDNAFINPSVSEICDNNLDEDCDGIDLACFAPGTSGAPIAISGISQYGIGAQAIVNFNLNEGSNSVEAIGSGNDHWYQFIAESNAVRIGLRGFSNVADDNKIMLFNSGLSLGQEWIALDSENAVSPASLGSSNDGGNETILFDQLVVGNTYLVCLQNINNTPGNVQLTIGHLNGSATDIGPYTQYTNTYNNACQNFKCRFRPNGTTYTVHRWNSASDDITGTPAWTYTFPNANSTICPLGKITPPNFSGQDVNLHVTVDVQYHLTNAFGTLESVNAIGLQMGSFILNSEPSVFVRNTDTCPVYKSPTIGVVATNRGVCGAAQYQWEWTMVTPNIGLPILVNGATSGARIFNLSQVAGMGIGQKYDVRIGVKHYDQISTSNLGSASCVRTIGSAGMTPWENELDQISVNTRLSYSIAPNPLLNSELNISWKESKEEIVTMLIQDLSGKTIWYSMENVAGYNHAIHLPHLASGVYILNINHEPTRLVIQ